MGRVQIHTITGIENILPLHVQGNVQQLERKREINKDKEKELAIAELTKIIEQPIVITIKSVSKSGMTRKMNVYGTSCLACRKNESSS